VLADLAVDLELVTVRMTTVVTVGGPDEEQRSVSTLRTIALPAISQESIAPSRARDALDACDSRAGTRRRDAPWLRSSLRRWVRTTED
jgi:hypothetical protein